MTHPRFVSQSFAGLLFTCVICAIPQGLFAQTILHVPPMAAPNTIFDNTTLNLYEDGVLPVFFRARSGSEVNINGGSVGRGFNADSGSTIHINGGVLAESFRAATNSTVSFRGGNMGDHFQARGTLHFFGDQFFVDDTPVAGLEQVGDTVTLQLSLRSQFTGVLSDGNPFSFSYYDNDDQLQDATITLERTALPSLESTEIHLPADPIPKGVRAGQTLYVESGSTLPDDFHAAVGSTVVVQGGSIEDNFEVAGAQVDVMGGSIGANFGAFTGSVVNVYDGTIGGNLRPLPGATVNLRGGTVGSVYVSNGAEVNISGGRIERYFTTRRSSRVSIQGEGFLLNGVSVGGLDQIGDSQAIDLPERFVLSGTLSGGTPFVFNNSSRFYDTFANQTLTLVRATTPPVSEPNILLVSGSPELLGVRDGETVLVGPGGTTGDHFIAGSGSLVVVDDGSIGDDFQAVGAQVLLRDGQIGDYFQALSGSRITIAGGSVGRSFQVEDGASVKIERGTIRGIEIASGGKATIHGGQFEHFVASAGSELELIGREFLLDGSPIAGLNSPGESLLLPNRGGELLTTVFDDGSVSELILRTPSMRGVSGNIATGSVLRLTVVPEPSGLILSAAALLAIVGCLAQLRTQACRAALQ